MKSKNRHAYAELVEALEHDPIGAMRGANSYSTTLALRSILLLSMAFADGYYSPVEYANAAVGVNFALGEVLCCVRAAEELHTGICDVDKFRWIAYYAQYVEYHKDEFQPKPFWKQLRCLVQGWYKLVKAKFVARREEK